MGRIGGAQDTRGRQNRENQLLAARA